MTSYAPTGSRPTRFIPLRLAFGSFALFAGLALLTGCGGKKNTEDTKNTVSGKVLLGDKPVNGTLIFVSADGKEARAPIGPDGSYTLTDPPIGSLKVYIQPGQALVAPKGGEVPKDGPAASGAVQPPAKYQTAASSGLTYDSKAGKQTYDPTLAAK
jgi:hypothetical protein